MTDLDSVEARLPAPPNLDFEGNPHFSGPEAPYRFKAELYHCEIHGHIPTAVDGTYYRTMPDQEWASYSKDDIFLAGDGVVNAFRFHNGQADFKRAQIDQLNSMSSNA